MCKVHSCSKARLQGAALIPRLGSNQLSTFSKLAFTRYHLRVPLLFHCKYKKWIFENIGNFNQKIFLLAKFYLKVKVVVVCMAYGNMIAFVLSDNSMLTFIVTSANLPNFMLTSIRWKSGITSSYDDHDESPAFLEK